MNEDLGLSIEDESSSKGKKKVKQSKPKKEQPEFIKRTTHVTTLTRALLISISSSLIVGGTIGAIVMHHFYKKYDDPNIKKIVETYEIMVNDWLFGDEDVAKDVTDNALSGMANQGDKYTFYTATSEEQNLTTTQKGLGFRYIYYGGDVRVKSVFSTSPAYSAGLRNDDIITKSLVDDTWVTLNSLSSSQALEALDNKGSNTISYNVTHSDSTTQVVSFTRASYNYAGVELVNSTLTSDDKLIATVKVDTFLDISLGNKMITILNNVEHNYSHTIDQLNIDVRDNGGGYVASAVDLLGVFVPKGTVVLQYLYKDGTTEDYKTTRSPSYANINNINIIQNKNSASASETFGLAMRYLKNARVVGQTSYGKGIVQSLKYYEDGSVLRYTVAKSQFPISSTQAVCIHGVGITPNTPYNFDKCFYYFGDEDFTKYDAESLLLAQGIIVDEINLLLTSEYIGYVEAVNAYQTAKGITVTGSINQETGRLLQRDLYDLYLNGINSIYTTYIG